MKWLACVLVLAACGGSERRPSGTRVVSGCTEGQTRACTCSDGRAGAQVCSQDRYEMCSCTGPVDTGVASDSGFTVDDAGFIDFGTQEPHDAGFVDFGFPENRDVGFIDFGFPDSGVWPDATVFDSGVRDAGFPDSGLRDTGVRDTGPLPDANVGPCTTHEECGAPLFYCDMGTCLQATICLSSAECPQGQLCHYVVTPLPIGICGPPCYAPGAAACASGTFCNTGTGLCQ